MNPSFNSIEIMGNVGKKPVISYLNNSTPVVRLRVCVNDRYTDKTTGQIKENTQWFSVLLYNKLAELAGEYLLQGDSVFIRGSMRSRRYSYNDEEREVWEIYADTMRILSVKKDRP